MTEKPAITIRQATGQDAALFVRVFELASHGLSPYIWSQMAKPDEDPREAARLRLAKRLEDADRGANLVAQLDGQAAGAMITELLGDMPSPVPDGTDPNIVPLLKLENEALGTRYINAVAVLEPFQGRGLGRFLVKAAIGMKGAKGTSLIVEDGNSAAIGLYERLGFQVRARQPLRPLGWRSHSTEYLLMVRDPG